jgi:hypothetical protein
MEIHGMSEPEYMCTKPPTHEVVQVKAESALGNDVKVETYPGADGKWYISICDEDSNEGMGRREVMLTASEAIAVAEFIATHVRKRW